MKLTKGIISRDEALKISKDYVVFVERNQPDFDAFNKMEKTFRKLKRGDAAITYNSESKQFVKVKVTSLTNDWRAEDGPVVRVSNGEFSWRVDGSGYAAPLS